MCAGCHGLIPEEDEQAARAPWWVNAIIGVVIVTLLLLIATL